MNYIRLPKHVRPERYCLTIKPNLEDFTFEGEESIELILGKSVKEITLHAKELKIWDAKLQTSNFKSPALTIKYDVKRETATIIFNKKLPKGKGELSLKFKGVLNDKMRGFYRSRYTHGGVEKHLATTQFEATDARQAFPCFDEPAQKAVFDVSLMTPPGLTAISNTVETSIQEHASGYKVVKFAPTPKMSTYLLAFIVGDFEFIEGKTRRGVKVRVFVTPGKKHQAKFALDTAIRTLDFYESYFAINYPLPVLDMIAIPDFSHGAMENWGAVTYRESALLVDPEHSSASNKQWVALVIAHELAHQWFGNLVTMEWWTHLWLNEGFASYIEYLAVNRLFPAWDIWTQFAYNDLGVALKLDALKNTHPIEVKVNHPDEIGEIFDEVSYSKGASVIRMLAGYLGEKDFRDGLRYYLKKHSYRNASTVHLWEAFEKISKKPIKKIMENWTKKAGYPVLRVIEKTNSFQIKQTRFFSSAVSKKESKDFTVWKAPLKIYSQKGGNQSLLLEKQSAEIPKKAGWNKFNFGETGFYRVDYPSQALALFNKPIRDKKIPAIDRLGIVRDAFALAESGQLPTSQALNLAKSYINENDYTVWVEVCSGLNAVASLISSKKYFENFKTYAQIILKRAAKNTGWKQKTKESHTKGLLRSLILHSFGAYGDKFTISKAKTIFNSKSFIPADIRSLVYNLAAENGGEKEYNSLLKKYYEAELHEEKNRLARALGQFKDPLLIKKTLAFSLSRHVRSQDSAQVLNAVWTNFQGRSLAWEFVKKNWSVLLERYPSSGHMLARFIKPAGYFSTEADLRDFLAFFKKHKAPGAQRAIEQTAEKIKSNIAWLERDSEHIENFLSKNGE